MFLGIDGCRGGWCCAISNDNGILDTTLVSRIDQIDSTYDEIRTILIDIPIGIGSKEIIRDLDGKARNELKPFRTSSIFSPPVREALMEGTYADACRANFQTTGRKISIQSWNISKKIVEVDTFIREGRAMNGSIQEAHPEICFKYLNNGKMLVYKKNASGKTGISERLNILSRYDSNVREIFDREIAKYKRKEVKPDDLVDAICLSITARLGSTYGFNKILGTTSKDIYNIEMSMRHFNPVQIETKKKNI